MKAPQFLAFGWRRFGPDGGQDSQELPCGDHLGKNKRPVLDRPLYITGWMTGVVHPVTNTDTDQRTTDESYRRLG